MRGKVACSAQKLGLLEPAMIQSIVDAQAFQIASHYISENRVRIVDADDAQISSMVIGNSGVYEQTIRLRDGVLATKCACTLNDQPLCRHSVAALLEYYRWTKPKPTRTPERLSSSHPATQRVPVASALEGTLSDVTIFVGWLQGVVKSLDSGQPLPARPDMKAGDVLGWMAAIERLHDGCKSSEEKQATLEADLRHREEQLGRLTEQLHNARQEAKEAQSASESLQRELAGCTEVLTKLSELADQITRCESQVMNVSGELVQKASNLDRLGNSFKEISTILHGLARQPPSKVA